MVCAYERSGDGWDSVRCAYSTAATGGYDVGGLAAGTYRVGFEDRSGTYLKEYYDDAVDADSGTDVVVAAAAMVTGIDASLALAPVYGYHIYLPLLNAAQP